MKINLGNLEMPINAATKSFANAMSLLRRNLLIKEENGLIQVNPEL